MDPKDTVLAVFDTGTAKINSDFILPSLLPQLGQVDTGQTTKNNMMDQKVSQAPLQPVPYFNKKNHMNEDEGRNYADLPYFPINQENHVIMDKVHVHQMIEKLVKEFKVIDNIQKRLSNVTYSQSGLSSLADAIINIAISLDTEKQSPKDKSMINDLFTSTIIQKIKQDELFYDDIKAICSIVHKKRKNVPQTYFSRIYHRIANIKKDKEVKIEDENKFKVRYRYDNSYKELTEEEIDEVVILEGIAHQIAELGNKVDLKLKAINKESDQVINFLNTIFSPSYEYDFLTNLKYDLSKEEVYGLAKISRAGCDKYDGAVFMLLVYFVKAYKTALKNQSKTKKEIMKFLSDETNKLILKLFRDYPPGKGLQSQEEKKEQSLLKQLEMKGDKSGKFSHQPYLLIEIDKVKQFKDLIIHYARVAKDNKEDFQTLIKKTCLEKCISFKVNLKLDPDDINSKAFIRVQEKILFPDQRSNGGNQPQQMIQFQQMIFQQSEESDFRKQEDFRFTEKIQEQLNKLPEITFNVFDMVRAKCIFPRIEDITKTITNIKQFAEQNTKKFRVIKIYSRFSQDPPISDVNLKIVINEAIVAQLQLTLQKNAASYNFAHQIYEVKRSQIFSKVKTIDNFYHEKKKKFFQLVDRCLKLQIEGKSAVNSLLHKAIRQYFEIQKVEWFELPHYLGQSLERISQKMETKIELKESLTADYQQLMMTLLEINLQVHEWKAIQKDKKIGQMSNNILNNPKISAKLKAILLQQIFKNVGLASLYPRLKAFCYQYTQILTEKKQKENIEQMKNNFMEDYMNYYFNIDLKILNQLSKETAKLFCLFTRLNHYLQVHAKWDKPKFSFIFKSFKFDTIFLDVVTGQMSEDNIDFLMQTAQLLYNQQRYSMSQNHVNWLQSILKNSFNSTPIMMKQINLLKAKLRIYEKHYEEAQLILQNIKTKFMEKQQLRKVAQCDLWLILCRFSKNKQYEEYQNAYEKYILFSQVHCMELKGSQCAEQQWLLANAIIKNDQDFNPDLLKKVLSTHFSKALIGYSVFLSPSDLLQKMRDIWEQFNINGINEPIFLQNKNIVNAYFDIKNKKQVQWLVRSCLAKWQNLQMLILSNQYKLGNEGCEKLSKGNWGPKLSQLNLVHHNISNIGIKELNKLKWENLTHLNFFNNNISVDGCRQIVKWNKTLISLNLGNNNIGSKGSLQLSKVIWPRLTNLNLRVNKIGPKGCQYLSQTECPQLIKLNLEMNQIGDKGCQHLKEKKWQKLTYLYLWLNGISPKGYQHLNQTSWPKLRHLNLQSNQLVIMDDNLKTINWPGLTSLNLKDNKIGDIECQYLIRSQSIIGLKHLILWFNRIGQKGCQHLSRVNWPHLIQLNLDNNQINQKACSYLGQGTWPNLTSLSLNDNLIQVEGCNHLSKGKWEKLNYLGLKGNKIGNKGCKHLNAFGCLHLELLNLENNDISHQGVSHLANSNWLELKILSLKSNKFGPVGCERLTKTNWPNLSILYLDSCSIDDQGCKHLRYIKWSNLTSLNLEQNQITDDGCLHLSKASWPNLIELSLKNNKIHDQLKVKELFNSYTSVEFK